MMASFRVSSQGINARIRMILWDPRITGIPNEFNSKYFEDNGYSAGITYAICYSSNHDEPPEALILEKGYRQNTAVPFFQFERR